MNHFKLEYEIFLTVKHKLNKNSEKNLPRAFSFGNYAVLIFSSVKLKRVDGKVAGLDSCGCGRPNVVPGAAYRGSCGSTDCCSFWTAVLVCGTSSGTAIPARRFSH
ncbi:hypothetical protein ILYODFUR_015557 [Ilyodon furcidens]|uniref:Uncharacterized protein n=1 Tax=Ilyodon furcidens TaxID=33524 RepID=A0ABV0VGP5_9TELE